MKKDIARQNPCCNPCNLCGGTSVDVLATRSRSRRPLRTVICLSCGLVWSDPLPLDPRKFYEDEYRLDYKGTYSPKPKHILRAGKVAIDRYRNFNVATLQAMVEKAGLSVESHVISADGGNITMIAKNTDMPMNRGIVAPIPGNAEKIVKTIRAHTPLRHYLGLSPYARFFRRMARAFREKNKVRRFSGGKLLLDALYMPLLKVVAGGGRTSNNKRY